MVWQQNVASSMPHCEGLLREARLAEVHILLIQDPPKALLENHIQGYLHIVPDVSAAKYTLLVVDTLAPQLLPFSASRFVGCLV